MVAFITASENPVFAPIGRGTTTIRWSTGDNTRGRVFVSVNGAAEQLFDPLTDADPGRPGARSGQKQQVVALGQTHVFRLKQAAPPNAVLATLTVTASFDSAVTLAAEAALRGLFQAIYDLKVSPGLDYVDFSFRTTQATVPVITLAAGSANGPAAGSAFPLHKGMQTAHEIQIGRPLGALDQGSLYFYRIEAAGQGFSLGMPAVVTGSFTTASQSADILFDRIVLHRDGDPNSKGDMTFVFGAGGAVDKDELGLPWPSYSAEMGDGETAFVSRAISIPNAPRRLWVGVVGEDDDSYFLGPLCTLGRRPAPTGPWTGHAEQEACEQAWVWTELDTFQNGELRSGTSETPFSMSTGNFGVAFSVHGRLRVTAVAALAMRMRTPPAAWPGAASVDEPGRLVAVSSAPGRIEMVALGPNGAVYHKAAGPGPQALPRGAWTRLGEGFPGGVTAVAAGEGGVDLFALDDSGAVHYRRHTAGRPPGRAWHRLGGAFAGPVAAAASARQGRIELFARDAQGAVLHRSLDTRGPLRAGAWEELGGAVAGPLQALDLPGAGMAVFALGRDGGVVANVRGPRGWRRSGWQSFGGSFGDALLAARIDEDALLLMVVDKERAVHVKRCRAYGRDVMDAPWQKIGTVDALFQALLAPPPPPAAPIDPALPSRAAPARAVRRGARPKAPAKTARRKPPLAAAGRRDRAARTAPAGS